MMASWTQSARDHTVHIAVAAAVGTVLGTLSLRHYYRKTCQLKILCRQTKQNADLLSKCEALSPSSYRPTPFYLLDYHGHIQTIAFSFIRQLFNRKLPVDRELFELSDGGTVGLDWVLGADTGTRDAAEAKASKPLVVLVHGLCGDTESVYITFAAQAFQKRGYDVISFVSRGCGGLGLTTMQGFTAARYQDLQEALEYLQKQEPKRSIFCVGYSLGAGILLNYLGANGNQSVLMGAVAISPSWNFMLETPMFHLWSALPLIGSY
jgi:predicted alpha/beta-fold hydrolase